MHYLHMQVSNQLGINDINLIININFDIICQQCFTLATNINKR